MAERIVPFRKTRDERYYFRGNFSDGGVCRLRIFEGEGRPPVVVFGELAENRNTSVTNMIEYLTAEVISKFLPWRWEHEPPAIVLEHYPAPRSQRFPERASGKAEYSVVTFVSWTPQTVWQAGIKRIRLGEPEWEHLPPVAVAVLLGEDELAEPDEPGEIQAVEPNEPPVGEEPVAAGDENGDAYDLPFDPVAMDVVCRRDPDGTRHFNIRPVALPHSPTGFEWGYGGSGPADFALNILAQFIPRGTTAGTSCAGLPGRGYGCVDQLAWELHQDFKWQFVAPLPKEGGTIPGETVRAWLRARGVPVHRKESKR